MGPRTACVCPAIAGVLLLLLVPARYYHPDVLDSLRDDPRHQKLIREVNEHWGLNPDGSFPDSLDVSFEADG